MRFFFTQLRLTRSSSAVALNFAASPWLSNGDDFAVLSKKKLAHRIGVF